MPRASIMRDLPDEASTKRLGAELAKRLRPGALILLEGDLGAGKTELARSILRALANDPELEVPSPSFSLVQPYEFGDLHVLHADLYRLADASEIEELGLFDDPQAIVMIEWPERAPELRTAALLIIMLNHKGAGREVVLSASDWGPDLADLPEAI